MAAMETPNWPKIIGDIQDKGGMSLRAIAAECGFSSAGALHDLKNEKQDSCGYEKGVALIELHRKVMRRGVRQ